MRRKSYSNPHISGTHENVQHKYNLRSKKYQGGGDSLSLSNESGSVKMAPRRPFIPEGIPCGPPNLSNLTPSTISTKNSKTNIIITLKIGLALVLFGVFISYVSEHKFAVLRTDISELRSHLKNVQDLNTVGNKKTEIEKQLMDIASTLPMLKEMAADLRDGIKGLDPCPAGDADSLRSVVKEEIEHYNADKTGRTDFALESSGGSILSTRDTIVHEANGATLSLFGIPLCSTGSSARALIQSGVLPGECWAFKGQTGTAVIKLINKIYVSGFSLEHIPQNISPTGDVSTAPKEFALYGLQNPDDTEGFFFGQYRYNIFGRSVQYFPVVHRSNRQYDIIEFKVISNHGHPEYTCIYRLRVHGDLTKKDA